MKEGRREGEKGRRGEGEKERRREGETEGRRDRGPNNLHYKYQDV